MQTRRVGKTPELSKEKWIGVLKLARLWDMSQVCYSHLLRNGGAAAND